MAEQNQNTDILNYKPSSDLQPLERVKEDILNRSIKSPTDTTDAFNKPIDSFNNQDHRVSFREYNVPLEEIYAPVGNDGTYVARYDSYVGGTNNAERAALSQSSWDKWSNGLAKAGVNLATTVAGSTIGSLTGITNWISEGFEMDALYTDDFNSWLDEVNEKMNYELPNYYTEQEQDSNFFQSMGTANFWANDVAKGISFTLGAIVGEGIWAASTGGASLATTAGRWGLRGTKAAKIAQGINNYQKLGKKMIRSGFSVNKARRAAQGAELLNTARFTYTSAGYEAGVEARQMLKEAEENYLLNHQEQYGRKPSSQEMAEFRERATTASNALYAGNVALVGGSNLAIFGKMFNISNPLLRSGRSLKRGVDRSLFGVGTETRKEGGKLVTEAVKPKKWQKALGYTNTFAKSAIIEGFWEEGNQSVMGNVANSWLESGYDEEATKNSYDLMEGIYDGYAETYGSKEGWKEVGIGMIVGLLGGGISGRFGDYGRSLQAETDYANALNDKMVGSQMLADKMFTQNQIFKANLDEQQATQNGDYTGQQEARKRSMLSSIRLHKRYDRLDQSFEDFKTALDLADSEQIAQENGIDVETVEDYKRGVLEEYKSLQDTYSDNKDFADYILGTGATTEDLGEIAIEGIVDEQGNQATTTKQFVSDAIAYNLTMGEKAGESSETLMDMIQDELNTIVSSTTSVDFSKALKVKDALSKASVEKRREYDAAKRKKNQIQERKRRLETEVKDSQQVLARTQDQERKQEISSRLIELSPQLEEANNQELEANSEFELAFQTLQLESPFRGEAGTTDASFITADQLNEISETDNRGNITGGTLFKIDQAINSLAQTNPKKYERFKKLFKEYEKSVYAFKEYNKTVQGITSPNFSPANFTTKLDQLIGKGRNANEFTKEYFANIGRQLVENTTPQTPQQQVEVVSQQPGDTMEVNPTTDVSVGDYVQWESQGTNQFEQPRKVRSISEDGNFAFVEGTDTGIPIGQLSKQGGEISPINRIKNLISRAIQQNSIISNYIGEDYGTSRPTQEEVQEYQDLHNKIEQGNFRQKSVIQSRDAEQLKTELGDQIALSQEEITRFQELNERLSNWQVIEGTMIDGINSTLADLVIRLQQLQTTPTTNQTKETINNSDVIRIEQASDKNSSVNRGSKSMVQTPEGVYLKVLPNGNREISHMTIESVWKNLEGATADIFYTTPESDSIKIITSPEQLRRIQKTEGYTFFIELENGTKVEARIGDKSRIIFTQDQWSDMQDNFNVKFVTAEVIDPQSQSFTLGYSLKEDGTLSPATSDFTIDTVDANRPSQMVETELRDTQTYQVFVDPKNTYNQKLLDELRTARKSRSKKAIQKAEENLRAQAVVYLMSNGKIAGTLRGGLNGLGTNNSSINYRALREQAAQNLLETQTENLVNLQTTVPVQFVYNGSPIFNLTMENGQPTIQNQDLTTRDLEQIQDAGYVQNGQLTVGKTNTENVNQIYLPNTQERTPVVVFNYRGEMVAFPVSLKGQEGGLQRQLDDILGFENISDGAKINRINEFLIQNGISPADYNLEERDLRYTNKIDDIRNSLENRLTYPNVEGWATNNYNLNNLRNEAQISINISNRPFNTPKIKLDLANAQITARTPRDTRRELETRRIEQVDNLQQFATTIEQGKNAFPEVVDSEFTDIIDEQPFSGGTSYLDKQKNINILQQLNKARKPKAVVDAYGRDFFTNLRNSLAQLNNIETQEANLKSEINMNTELTEEVESKKKEDCNS